MSDKQSKKIEKSVEKPFYGSQEMPKLHAFGAPNNGIKTGKPRSEFKDPDWS